MVITTTALSAWCDAAVTAAILQRHLLARKYKSFKGVLGEAP